MEMKISVYLGIFGTYPNRHTPDGFHDAPEDPERELEVLSRIEGLRGVNFIYPNPSVASDPDTLVRKCANHNLRVANIFAENWAHRKWKHGAFSTGEEAVRRENIRLCKETIDFAAEIPGAKVELWPAYDGFDYFFEVDYRAGWKRMTDSLREIVEYNPRVELCLEYKQKDPRQKSYVSNVGKAMMLFHDVGAENLGAALDTGHALLSQENLAESALLLYTHGRLGTIHLNDNYRDADPDLIIGTVAFWDLLELYYFLNKTDYAGWNEIDVVSPRHDRVETLKLAVKMIRDIKSLADRLTEHSDDIDANMAEYRFTDNMKLIMDILF